MSDQLSLQSTKPNTQGNNLPSRAWYFTAAAAGLFVLLFGAADIATRAAKLAYGKDASLFAFAPAVLLSTSAKPSTTPTQNVLTTTVHATSTPLVPSKLVIPSIGVTAQVELVGKQTDGSMGTPKNFSNVGWYALGSKPGEPGSAVFDGHVNNALTKSGVFQHLTKISLGDTIQVLDASSTALTYVVTKVQEYDANANAADAFTSSGPSQLVLITCEGEWVPATRSYSKRFVVFASLR